VTVRGESMNRTRGSARQHGFADGFTTCQARQSPGEACGSGMTVLSCWDPMKLQNEHTVKSLLKAMIRLTCVAGLAIMYSHEITN